MELMINHAFVMKPPQKSQKYGVQRTSRYVLGDWCTQRGHRPPCLFQYTSSYGIVSLLVFTRFLYHINNFNKMLNVSVSLSTVSSSSKLIEPSQGTLWFIASWSEAQVMIWTFDWHLKCVWGARSSLVRLSWCSRIACWCGGKPPHI